MNEKLLSQFQQDMQLRGLGESTQQAYLNKIGKFAEFLGKSPRQATARDVNRYLHHLMTEKRFAIPTVNQYAAALRLFLTVTVEKTWAREKIVFAKAPKKLPDVLSGTEVLTVLRAFDSIKHKTVALCCYGAGLRINETLHLKVKDIDSKRNVIVVRNGKGQKDRQVPLSPRLLKSLRLYFKRERPGDDYLFPGRSVDGALSKMAFAKVLKPTVKKAGIGKHVTAHVFRHSYATHLIEAGADLRSVQVLMGHASIQSTARYVHLTTARMLSISSPLELLGTVEGNALG
jgi:site-specific recombinase XerD